MFHGSVVVSFVKLSTFINMIVLDETCVYIEGSANTAITEFKYVSFNGNFKLLVHTTDGYFNATKLCAMKKKKIFHFQESNCFKLLESMLLQRLEFDNRVRYTNRDLGFTNQSAVGGIYYHPILFLALASWCDKEFYVKVAVLVNNFFSRTAERRALLFDRAFSLKPVHRSAGDSDFCVDTSFPTLTLQIGKVQAPLSQVCRVVYAGFELWLDEKKYFNASRFCCTYADESQSLRKFSKTVIFLQHTEHLKSILNLNPMYDKHNVIQKSPEYGTYYHPLLFLALARWVKLDCYVKASKIVFAYLPSYDRDSLLEQSALAQRAEDYTTATLSTETINSNVSATTAEGPDTTTDVLSEEELSTDVTQRPNLAPTTPSSIESPVQNERVSTFTWVDNDNTCSAFGSNNTAISDMYVNVFTKAEMDIERKSWQLRLDHAEKKHSTKLQETTHKYKKLLDQKQSEKAELLKKLKDVEHEKNDYYLRSTTHKNRVDELTQELEQLKLSNERLRITKLKRNPVDEKYNLIQDVYNSKFGKDRMEMLIITCSGNGCQYYGFRRKIKGVLNTINGRTRTELGDSVKLWFVSNNAKQDYIDCKSYLYDKAHETGVKLKTQGNNIGFGDKLSVEKFNTVEIMRDFGKLVGMIELDPGFLQTVLELIQNNAQSSPSTSTQNNQTDTIVENLVEFITRQPDQMVQSIYKYVLDDYKQSN